MMHAAICPGVEPSLFWRRAPALGAWASMLDKYAALARAAALAEGPRDDTYKRALTELSSRWPGALREGELIGPVQVQARADAAARGLAQPERAREHWLDAPAHAVMCWAELHMMIADLLAFRRRVGGSPLEFAAWLDADPARAQRWPNAARLPELLGPKLEVRSAYLWLAARSGVGLPQLNRLLLGRSGHWDHRAGDPTWAHGGA